MSEEIAQAAVDGPTIARQAEEIARLRHALIVAYTDLREWHDRAHSRNRPPDLNCTGCVIWPIIAALADALGFDALERRFPEMSSSARFGD